MRGLLIKELLGFRSNSKSFIPMFIIFLALGIITKDTSFIGMMLGSLCLGQVMNSFGYDDKASWEKFALSTPITRNDLVVSKYIYSLLLLFISLIITSLFSLGLVVFKIKSDLLEIVLVNYATFYVIGVILFVLLPLIFKFGIEKARNYILPIWGIITVAMIVIMKVFSGSKIIGITFSKPLILFFLSLLGLVGIFLISYKISIGIYLGKDL